MIEVDPAFTFVTIASNSSPLGGGLFASKGSFYLDSSSISYNSNYNYYDDGTGGYLMGSNNHFYSPNGSNSNVMLVDVLTSEPKFMSYDSSALPSDFHLQKTSPLVSKGSIYHTDVDGSKTDIGGYGGELANLYDRDLDGYPDYFWPGYFSDVPSGVSSSTYDCNDLNAASHTCF